MKINIFAITVFLSFFLVSCDQTNYNRGYDDGYNNGYNKGGIDGYTAGYKEGQKTGYDQGYNDGFKKSHKDLTITESNTKYFYDTSYLIFTYVFYCIFVLTILIVLIFSIIGSNQDGMIIFGKLIFLVVALTLAYLTMRIVDLNTIIFFKIEGDWGWIVILSLFPVAIFLSWIIERLFSLESIYLEIFVTFLSTFILFYFGLFLTDIKMYLINNQFYSSCIISATMGGLVFTAYKIITNRLEYLNRRKEKLNWKEKEKKLVHSNE